MIEVVAGFIQKENKILVVKRPPHKKRGGLWEFPGGKVKKGETLKDALKRELKEEMNIEAEVKELLAETEYLYPDEKIKLYLFKVEVNSEPILKEAVEKRWVKFEELKNLKLCPADKELLKNFQKLFKVKLRSADKSK